METASFARKEANGTIACSDYGYKKDLVYKMVEAIYLPVSQYSEEQKSILESSMKTNFERYEALDCCTVKIEVGTNYLTVSCTYSDMNKKEVCAELYEAGILNMNSLVSMKMSESGLLAKGSVKK